MTEVFRILSCLALAVVASGAPTASAFEVDAALSGGNVRVLGVTNETVRVAPDIRDTTRWWFWWRFRVTGAAGRTLGFEFPGNECGPVGSRGPVVSTDRGLTWHYAPRVSSHAFTYTFGADENETWFAQTIPYDEVHWRRFLDRHAAWRGRAFEEGVLCTTARGYRAEKARFGCLTGDPRFRVCLTARHHAAEATGSYVLEGVLDRVLADDDVGAWLRANVEFLVVPFMDKDGVVDGDQGKCRKPHDHNRDYLLRRHPTVAATEDWILAQPGRKLDVFLDLHSPWIDGLEDERFYAWYSRENWNALEERRFGRMLERNQRGAMRYRIQDDPREFSVRRAAEYTEGRLLASELWALRALDSLRLGLIFETPFAVANGATVAEDAWREIGGDIAQTLKEFLLSPTPTYPSCDGVYPHLAVFNGSSDCRLKLTTLGDGALEAQTCDRNGKTTSCDWRYRIDSDLRQRILLPDAPRPSTSLRPSVDVGFDDKGEFARTPDGSARLPRIAGRPCGEIAVGKETAVIGGVVWRIPEWHPVRATPETVTSVSTLGGRPVWGIAGGPSAAPLKATANVLFSDKDALAERPFVAEATVWKNETVAAGALSDPIAVDGFDSYEARATAPVECMKVGGNRVRLRATSTSTNLTASLVCTKRGVARPLDARLQKLPSLADDEVKKGIGVLHCDPRRPDFIWYHSPTDGDFELEPDLKLHPARSYAYGDAKTGEGDYVRARILEDAPKASDITHVDPSQVLGRFRRPFRPGRDLVNFGGVLYELPTEGGDDWSRLKPLVRHGRAITDFITWNGLLVLVGAEANSLTVISADALGVDYGGSACAADGLQYDLVVYGSSPAALTAAIQARRMGLKTVVVSPETRIGGLTAGGLGQTDMGNKKAFGGLALDFYRAVADYYREEANWTRQKRGDYLPDGQCAGTKGTDSMWTFEPSAALKILEGWEKREGLEIHRGKRLDRATGKTRVEGQGEQRRIVSFVTEDGTEYRGKMFVDATYEGDLMAAAGVTYFVGREGNAVYGERLNGIQRREGYHKLEPKVSGYVIPGDVSSGFLPNVVRDTDDPDGTGDRRVQAYCFRMCLTDDPANRIPFRKPVGYRELDYELLFRNFAAGAEREGVPWINSTMPNRKTDTNNRGGFSTDFIGRNWNWPEASYAEREKILAEHLAYQRGLMWTLANHPRVPERIRAEVSKWGTCRDEFADGFGDGWQRQLYVREARRLVGEYVMTEHDCCGEKSAPRPVALGAYSMDSHHVRRYADRDGFVQNEGDVEVYARPDGKGFSPYGIDYGALLPKRSECGNLLVPVCLSASHIAFGSIRMEPVFFALGQAAGTAAALAVQGGTSAQDVDYTTLKARLEADGQVLRWPVAAVTADRAAALRKMAEDRLGLFIHWGVYSVPARGEWMMQRENVPSAEYAKYADAFRPPTSFSPREWVKLAKRAGARYAVLTTRHHDGFALFDTKTTDFNSVRTTGRDFVREFCEACRAEGIRVGLYFSLMNWQYWRTGGAYEPAAWAEQVRTTREALRELMTNYGKVDYLWYDGCQAPGGNDAVRIQALWDTRGLNEMVRRLQPDILINDRSARPEDYATPEQTIDPPPRGRMWESCLTCNRNWGYCAADTDWKSSESLFRSLLHCCRFGGNLLVNVGPRPDGSVPEACVKALEGLGDRIAACPEAIYGTERDDFTEATHEAGVVTKSAGTHWLWALNSNRLGGAEKLEPKGPGVYRVRWRPGARPCRWLGGRHDVEPKPGEAPTLCDDTGRLEPPIGPVEERSEPPATSATFVLPAGGRWRLEVGYVTKDGFKDTLEETYLASAPGERHVIGLPSGAKGVYAVRQTPVWTCRRPTEWQVAGVFRTEARARRYAVDYIKEIFASHDFPVEAKRATFVPVGSENLKADHGDVLVSHTWSAPEKEIGYAFGRLVLTSARDETVMAAAGADWQWKVFVNGETAVDLTMGPKPRMFPLKLRKGANEILVVSHCGSGQHFFSFYDNCERVGDSRAR